MLTAIVPARNEPYLQKTVESLISNAEGEIEVIVILDGYWPNPIFTDPHVVFIHNSSPKGLRAAINDAASIAKGDYLLKCDAHCMFAEGYDKVLVRDIKDHQVMIPRRYPLDPEKWEIEKRNDDKYPIDYEAIDSSDLHGIEWRERRNERKDIMIDETMTAQGSCWFMSKKHFEAMGNLDEAAYGTFFLEFQEISFKTWLSGGKVMVNKNTWYAHWHKNEGRGYSLAAGEREKAVEFMAKWKSNTAWDKQTVPFQSMIDRFLPMPGWEMSK